MSNTLKRSSVSFKEKSSLRCLIVFRRGLLLYKENLWITWMSLAIKFCPNWLEWKAFLNCSLKRGKNLLLIHKIWSFFMFFKMQLKIKLEYQAKKRIKFKKLLPMNLSIQAIILKLSTVWERYRIYLRILWLEKFLLFKRIWYKTTKQKC
jgi:hypothetical protein